LFLQDDVNCGLFFNDIMFVLIHFADDMVKNKSFTLNHKTLSGKGLKTLSVLLNNLNHLNLTTKTKMSTV